MTKANIKSWVAQQKILSRKWLIKTLSMEDGRWSKAAIYWQPQYDDILTRKHQRWALQKSGEISLMITKI